MTDDTRTAFEVWWIGLALKPDTPHWYTGDSKEAAWSAWQCQKEQGRIPRPPEGYTPLAYERRSDSWAYLNHANTWQGCSSPIPPGPWKAPPAAVPEKWRNTIAFAAGHLKTWLDDDLCECEVACICGRLEVKRSYTELMEMIAAPAPPEPEGGCLKTSGDCGIYPALWCYRCPKHRRNGRAL